MFRERLLPLKVPVVAGLPFGHIPLNATLPVGVRATLDAVKGDLIITDAAVKAQLDLQRQASACFGLSAFLLSPPARLMDAYIAPQQNQAGGSDRGGQGHKQPHGCRMPHPMFRAVPASNMPENVPISSLARRKGT